MLTEATARNLRRKSAYADHVQMRNGVPVFSWVDLSVTELCNRSAGNAKACTFCPRINPEIYPNQKLHMPIPLAAKIAEELHGLRYEGAVVLCGFGEPLLHPNIVGLVRCFAPFRVEIVTNGDRLSPELVSDLIEAGCDFFVVSMYDGPHQIEQLNKALLGAGADHSYYILRDRWHGPDNDFGLKLTNRAGTIDVGHQPAVDIDARCYYPAYQLAVDWNGDVLLCVQDWNKRVRYGNLNSQSLWDIWTSPAMRKRRMKLARGDRSDSPCSGCNADGCLHGAAHVAAWNG